MIISKYVNHFLIFTFTDIFEILFFSSLIYFFSKWLKRDKNKNLLVSFYFMLLIFIVSFFTHMATISNFMLTFYPAMLMLLFLIHQNTLQKSFVSASRLSANIINPQTAWIEDFIRSCLSAMGNNKQISCIIEGTNQIKEFVDYPFLIDAQINKNLTDLLINNEIYDQQKMIWLTFDGKIEAINTQWKITNDIWYENNDKVSSWQQNGIIVTSKLDSIVFKSYPSKRSFDIILHGRLIEDITPNGLINLITHFIKKTEIKTLKKEWISNENVIKKNWSKQSLA